MYGKMQEFGLIKILSDMSNHLEGLFCQSTEYLILFFTLNFFQGCDFGQWLQELMTWSL